MLMLGRHVVIDTPTTSGLSSEIHVNMLTSWCSNGR